MEEKNKIITTTWNNIISLLAPLMVDECSEYVLRCTLDSFFKSESNIDSSYSIDDTDFQTIKVQLIALCIMKISERKRTTKSIDTHWTLTPYGNKLMMKLKALKRQ